MTNPLWPYTPKKRTLGQYDYSHTVDQCVFEPSKVSLPLTDLCCITGSLPSSKKPPHLIQGLDLILKVMDTVNVILVTVV